jgi:hypothetical protein
MPSTREARVQKQKIAQDIAIRETALRLIRLQGIG